ncbi:MAG: hypothetical protein MUE46_17825 [Xanthomonadales bacterium]|jgi:hypothetical protein|nr:hypothetical protein [Xanthomonadales bacterium]
MDLLTDLLRQSGLQQRLLDLGPFAADELRRFPCGRSFGFHLVLEGAIGWSRRATPRRCDWARGTSPS